MESKTGYSDLLKNKRAFENVSTRIKKLIIQGVFKPGDKLPSEAEMARQFKVGRQTVREALRLLELSGFLAVHQGARGGSVITNTILDTLSKSFLDAVQMKNITVAEVIAARREIDKIVISQAILHATDADLALLNENISKATQKIEKGIPPFEENITFNTTLAKASHNGIFVILVESMMTIMADFLSRTPQTLAVSQKNVNDHRDILNALTERNEARALLLTDNHLRLIEEILVSSFEKGTGVVKRKARRKQLNANRELNIPR